MQFLELKKNKKKKNFPLLKVYQIWVIYITVENM